MYEFVLGAAALVLVTVALGLVMILRGPGDADRMMATQLLGTGGTATLLLFGHASEQGAVSDVALTLALLAAFASIAFARAMPSSDDAAPPAAAVDPRR
jgi:multicomponent Na+:H+ antiporter subunit F